MVHQPACLALGGVATVRSRFRNGRSWIRKLIGTTLPPENLQDCSAATSRPCSASRRASSACGTIRQPPRRLHGSRPRCRPESAARPRAGCDRRVRACAPPRRDAGWPAADQADLAELARDHRGVRSACATAGEQALGEFDAGEIARLGVLAHQDQLRPRGVAGTGAASSKTISPIPPARRARRRGALERPGAAPSTLAHDAVLGGRARIQRGGADTRGSRIDHALVEQVEARSAPPPAACAYRHASAAGGARPAAR